tara:strand:- start:665 stop:934 length:270 start_codon:yes stop_codon:yes gene_type:complete
MEFVTFEDETDIYECVMFPKVFAKYGDLLHWEKLFIVRGKVEKAFGVFTVTIEKLGSIQQVVKKMKEGKDGNRQRRFEKHIMENKPIVI